MKRPKINNDIDREVVERAAELVIEKSLSRITDSDIDKLFSGKQVTPGVAGWIGHIIKEGRSDAQNVSATTAAVFVGDTVRELRLTTQFTAPTGMLPILPTFGDGDLPVGADGRARGKVRRYIFREGTAKEIQLELPYQALDQGVEPLERQLRKSCRPLGLKVLLGVLHECHVNHQENWFPYDVNFFCDLLGYSRDSKGRHQTLNKKRVDETVRSLMGLKYTCEWWGERPGDMDKITIPLLYEMEESEVRRLRDYQEIINAKVVVFCPMLYADITTRGLYTWIDERFLKLDARLHGRAIQLGSYYSTAWRIDWKNSQGKLHRKLRTILVDSGIHLTPTQEKRMIEAVKRDHDYMAKEGLIKNWRIIEPAGNPLDEVWEIVIPDYHGLLLAKKKQLT